MLHQTSNADTPYHEPGIQLLLVTYRPARKISSGTAPPKQRQGEEKKYTATLSRRVRDKIQHHKTRSRLTCAEGWIELDYIHIHKICMKCMVLAQCPISHGARTDSKACLQWMVFPHLEGYFTFLFLPEVGNTVPYEHPTVPWIEDRKGGKIVQVLAQINVGSGGGDAG